MSERVEGKVPLDILGLKPQRVGVGGQADEETFVVMLSDGRAFRLAPHVFYVWAMCDGERTVSEIIDEISALAEVDRGEVEEPVITIVRVLLEHGLLSTGSP